MLEATGMPLKGYKQTEEHKEKNRQANLGRVLTEEHKKKVGDAHRGKIVSEETRKKISDAHRGKSLLTKGRKFSEEHKVKLRANHARYWLGKTREKSPHWKGGSGFGSYTPEFNENLKDLVRERDGYMCQICDKPQCQNGKKLCVHHIDYDKKNNVLSNLIALCCSCHSRTNKDRGCWCRILICEVAGKCV